MPYPFSHLSARRRDGCVSSRAKSPTSSRVEVSRCFGGSLRGTSKAMNQLKMQQQSIVALFEQGWSKRRMARELGLEGDLSRAYHWMQRQVPCWSRIESNPNAYHSINKFSITPGAEIDAGCHV